MNKLTEELFHKKFSKPMSAKAGLRLKDRFLKDNPRYEAHWLGDDDSNLTSVNAGGSSAAALVERITNAVDAVCELYVYRNPAAAKARTQKELINEYMGYDLPYMNNPQRKALAIDTGRIDRHIILENGKVATIKDNVNKFTNTEQCITIQDGGIGMAPDDMRVLKLKQSNKNGKPWLQGQFGQGGSNTFAFCNLSFLSSRKVDTDEISFSVVWKQPPNKNEKRSTYMMIVDKNTGLPMTIPVTSKTNMPYGTRITHFDYVDTDIKGMFSSDIASFNSIYRKLLPSYEMPFYYVDHDPRAKDRKDHVLQGSGTILERWKVGIDAGKSNSVKVEYISMEGDKDGFEDITFVVDDTVYTIRGRVFVLRRKENPLLHFDKNKGFYATINGQTLETFNGRASVFTAFPSSRSHMCIEADLGTLPPEQKSDLTLSNRDGLQEGKMRTAIIEAVRLWLLDQQDLEELEQRWKRESFSSTVSNKKSGDMARAIGLYNIKPKHLGGNRTRIETAFTRNGKNVRVRKKYRNKIVEKGKLIEPKIIPTYIKLIHEDPLPVYAGEKGQYAMVETDAMDGWTLNFEVVSCTNKNITVFQKFPLKNGRARVYIDARTAQLFDTGTIVASLTTARGKVYSDNFSFQVKERATTPMGGKLDKKGNTNVKVEFNEPLVVCHPVGFDSKPETQDMLISGSPSDDLFHIGGLDAVDESYVDEDHTGRIDIWMSTENRTLMMCMANIKDHDKYMGMVKEQMGLMAINALNKQHEAGIENVTTLGVNWSDAIEQASLTVASTLVKL